MNSYNGYSPAQRMKALTWLKGEYAAGRRQPPVQCEACGQTEGVIEPHSEDYSAPYGEHTGRYGLCYTCHLMIHCRIKNAPAWERYKAAIRCGLRYPPAQTRSFYRYVVPLLNGAEVASTRHDPPTQDLFGEMGL